MRTSEEMRASTAAQPMPPAARSGSRERVVSPCSVRLAVRPRELPYASAAWSTRALVSSVVGRRSSVVERGSSRRACMTCLQTSTATRVAANAVTTTGGRPGRAGRGDDEHETDGGDVHEDERGVPLRGDMRSCVRSTLDEPVGWAVASVGPSLRLGVAALRWSPEPSIAGVLEGVMLGARLSPRSPLRKVLS
jgi:hypothetical protein